MRVANNGILYSIGDKVRFIHKRKTLEGYVQSFDKQRSYIVHVKVNGKLIYSVYDSQITSVVIWGKR